MRVLFLTRGLLRKSKQDENSEFSKGIELIYSQLNQFLEDEGIIKINTHGKFDPRLHEVIITEESDKENGTILQEFQKGYMLNDRVLRPAKVKIVKNKITNEVKNQDKIKDEYTDANMDSKIESDNKEIRGGR